MPDILPRNLNPGELNDFVRSTVADLKSPHGEEDVITPRHPLFERLEKRGTMETRSPGQGVVEDLHIANPEHIIIESQSVGYSVRDWAPEDVGTRAKFDYISLESNLTLATHHVNNCTGAAQLVDLIESQKKAADNALRARQVDILWNGLTSGSEHVYGIKEFVLFGTPVAMKVAENPATGSVGGIDSTTVLGGTYWFNYAHDFNTAYLTTASGEVTGRMTAGADSLLALWLKLTANSKGDVAEGIPDLMPCNEKFYEQIDDLVSRRLVFQNKVKDFEMSSLEPYWFRGAAIFHDPNVGDTPTAGEGMAYLLNTGSFSYIYAEGLKEQWSDIRQSVAKTGNYWTRLTQIATTVRDRRKNGLFLGSKAASHA